MRDLVIEAAVLEYFNRKSGTSRIPAVFVRNSGGTGNRFVWYPATSELRKCCMEVPFSKRYHHCKSTTHIATLFGVDKRDLARAIKEKLHATAQYT